VPAADVVARLARALDDGDADQVGRLIECHWSYVIRTDAPLLLRATREVAGELLDRHPVVALVQELFAPVRSAIMQRDDPLLDRALAGYAGLDDHRARVGVGLATMIALTRRGRFTEAAAHGDRVAELGIELLDPGYQDGASLPALELHAGIAHLMAADLTGAERHLSAAYRNLSPFANHGLDAAGKLGFLYALRGESHLATTWLERSQDLEPGAGDWWLRATERQSIAGASMLLAIDRLDWPAFHRHNLTEDMAVPSENWLYVVYARARAGLFLGNQRILINELHDFRDQLPLIFTDHSLPRMLLDSAELDLLLSLGDLEAAEEVADRLGDDPMERVAAARFRLARGDAAAAEEIVADSRWPVRISRRVRLNLLLLQVTADLALRLSSDDRIRLLQRAAVETANEVDPWLFTLAVQDPATAELLGRYAADTGPLLSRLREIDPPRPFRLSRPPDPLTPRERVLLGRLAGAAALEEIAAELHVSPATVRNQRKSLYRKLGATSRAHAVEIGLRAGLLPADGRPDHRTDTRR
jgi:LuxR family maltose regulon positive regulatory protein